MGNGLYHENEAIAILQKELASWNEALKGWDEKSMNEYSEAYNNRKKRIKQIEKGIEILIENIK